MIEDSFPLNTTEQLRSTDDLYREMLLCEPKEVSLAVPANADEQMKLFLSGEVRNPRHTYGKLDEVDFDQRAQRVRVIGGELLESIDNPKYEVAYRSFVDSYLNRYELLDIAQKLQSNPEDAELKSEFMKINIERNGEPNRQIFESMLSEKLRKIDTKQLNPDAQKLREELKEYIGDFEPTSQERFKPSPETLEWAHEVINSLFENLLRHVPDEEVFTDTEIKEVFDEIIREEFEEAGEDWQVVIEEAQSIKVKASEKIVVVPIGKELDNATLRLRIVHELGIHMLRSVSGAQSDLPLLETGLVGYYDSEEGLGVVAEQALTGKYKEAGESPYITAGIAYHLEKDFRDTFEIKWRLGVLTSYKSGTEISEETIKKSKSVAYNSAMRSFRLTDTMPWFKDLSYYNGANSVWEHLESIRGDDIQLALLFLGKGDPSDGEQKRILLETNTP